MTVQHVPDPPTTPGRRDIHWGWSALVVLGVVVAGAGFIGGAAWTRHETDLGGWHTGVAQTGIRQISIEDDGWTYGASGSVDQWIDRDGSVHDSGWPDCLRVPPGSKVTVRFQAQVVTIDDMTRRPIVAIDCGDAASAPG
jgi:hypothetical protein